MFKFMRIHRDPGTNEGGADNSAEIKALEDALMDEGGAPNVDIDKDKEAGGDKADDQKTGADNKGKGSGDKKDIQQDDPEHEIETKDDKGQITKNKIRLSELKAGYLRQQDYTTQKQRVSEVEKNQADLIKTIEAIRANPKLSKLFVGMIEGAIGKDGYNDSFIDKQLSALQGVQPAAGDTKTDLKDKQEDIEDLLKEVDPDSPIAKALRQTYAMNKKLMEDYKSLSEKVGSTTKAVEERATKEQEAQYKTLVDGASKMMNDHLDGMTDAAKDGAVDFWTDGEKQEWRYKVVAFLRDNPQEYKDEKEFIARIDQVGKAIHSYMVKLREGIILRGLENKKNPVQKKPEEQKQSADAETFEQALEKELSALDGSA